jgi:hypothetical protein
MRTSDTSQWAIRFTERVLDRLDRKQVVEVGLGLSLSFIILACGTRRSITGLVDEEMRKSIDHKGQFLSVTID